MFLVDTSDVCSSQHPGKKEMFGEVGDSPVLYNKTILESTRHHVVSYDRVSSSRVPIKVTLWVARSVLSQATRSLALTGIPTSI